MTAPERALTSRMLVLSLVDSSGALAARDAYDVGELLGFTVHQIRLVLARLVEEGLLAGSGRGRRAVFQATDRHQLIHGPEAEWLSLAYQQDLGAAGWDGHWHLVSFSISEDRRKDRGALREMLTAMGGASLGGGAYLHALDWTGYVHEAAGRLGVADSIVTARAGTLTVGGRTRPRDIAGHLWPIAEISAGYTAFLARHAATGGHVPEGDPARELAAGVELIAAFEAAIRPDPLLPPELLPDRWPGQDARRVLLTWSRRIDRLQAMGVAPRLFSRYDEVFASLDG